MSCIALSSAVSAEAATADDVGVRVNHFSLLPYVCMSRCDCVRGVYVSVRAVA